MSENKVLGVVNEKLDVSIGGTLDPKEFFKNRKGLYVWSDFNERILEKTQPTEAGKNFTLTVRDLLKYATDSEIEDSLGEGHNFSESDVCAIVADLVVKQSKGESGVLLSNGNFNLFYTPSFVVDVNWDADDGEWFVCTWGRDDGGWGAGARVFSPATDL